MRFASKAHGFDIELADLKVGTPGKNGTITADVTSSGTTADDVKFAALDLSGLKPGGGAGGTMTYANIPAKLTAEGAKAFNGMYKAGQALDPATLSASRPAGPGRSPLLPTAPRADPGRASPAATTAAPWPTPGQPHCTKASLPPPW